MQSRSMLERIAFALIAVAVVAVVQRAPAFGASAGAPPAVGGQPVNEANVQRLPSPMDGGSAPLNWLSSLEFSMSMAVLVFGLLVAGLETLVIHRRRFSPNDATKLVGVTLIVVSTLFIITAGYSSEQIAPAMGLFGTIAGYLLGRYQGTSAASAQSTVGELHE